ncbi:SDR family NAD(P)-dependent oxidoreductase [Actinacidiphila glaucinigra]|uniref:SDR family NAD(P)-dependent oxidoreductase n=1 Tax=Actinacidiphila glaucinigra TaxID=235986 RepID=UPI002DD9A92C|nr:SDR family NAD(P)-dependent oxidoreductase [Actinacidiphila glaucinigra]WSD64820.1 SDR family NAD(P)-dependent oxidoreductase [Actinacidiphila glaucinigra]
MNRGVLVTGASRGIGRAVAAALARAGDQAAVHCNRSAREAEQVAASGMTRSAIDGPVGANAAALLRDLDEEPPSPCDRGALDSAVPVDPTT